MAFKYSISYDSAERAGLTNRFYGGTTSAEDIVDSVIQDIILKATATNTVLIKDTDSQISKTEFNTSNFTSVGETADTTTLDAVSRQMEVSTAATTGGTSY